METLDNESIDKFKSSIMKSTVQSIIERLNNPLVYNYVLIEANVIVGFVSFFKTQYLMKRIFSFLPDYIIASIDSKISYIDLQDYILIESIAVSRNYRNKVYGRALMSHALEVIGVKHSDLTKVRLYVASHNNFAIRLYNNLGFVHSEKISMPSLGIDGMEKTI